MVILTVTAYSVLILWKLPEWDERGSFGDMFGGVNALFTGIALIGVVYAIHLQRQDLVLQRKELELTRHELSRTAEAQEEASQMLAKQVWAMHESSRLNALGALVQAHASSLSGSPGSALRGEVTRKMNRYVERLETELAATPSSGFSEGNSE